MGPRGLSKSFISRVIIGVTPFRVLITLLITYLLSPLPLQVGVKGLGVWFFSFALEARSLCRMVPTQRPQSSSFWGVHI